MGRKPKPGNVIKARGPSTVHGLEVKQWQRTPRALLLEYCQKNKRPKPIYQKASAPPDQFRTRVVLPDPKGVKEKNIVIATQESYDEKVISEHSVALLMLHHMDGARQYHLNLPEPFRTAWIDLNSDIKEGKNLNKNSSKSGGKKPTAASKKLMNSALSAGPQTSNDEISKSLSELSSEFMGTQVDVPSTSPVNSDNRNSVFEQSAPEISPSKKRETFQISKQGNFATDYDRRLAKQQRENERRAESRLSALKARSNPLTKVFMSEENQKLIENILRLESKASGKISKRSIAVDESMAPVSSQINRLVEMGFRIEDAQEALKHVGTQSPFEHLLDWLCVYSPKEYLPKSFNPTGKQFEIVKDDRKSVPMCYIDLLRQLNCSSECLVSSNLVGESDQYDVLFSLYGGFVKQYVDASAEWPEVSSVTSDPSAALSLQEVRDDEIMALQVILEDTKMVSSFFETPLGDYAHHSIRIGEIAGVPGMNTLDVFCLTASQSTDKILLSYPDQNAAVFFSNSELNRHVLMSVWVELNKLAIERKGLPHIYELWDLTQSLVPKLQKERPYFASSPTALSTLGTVTQLDVIENFHRSKGSHVGQAMRERQRRFVSISSLKNKHQTRENLYKRSLDIQQDSAFRKMIETRSKLPAFKEKDNVLYELKSNQVVLVCGGTGCGKTTQIPQYILDDYIGRKCAGEVNIICAQPRRIAAMAVATRICEERCERIGDVVGFQVRSMNKTGPTTRLAFVTTGILLRRLLNDQNLSDVSHVIIDEVHERNVETDFLLSLAKRLLIRRPDLKLLLMSATMESEMFMKYFDTRSLVSIPGFTYPVRNFYLPEVLRLIGKTDALDTLQDNKAFTKPVDYSYAGELVHVLDKERQDDGRGAILIFVSGVEEINRVISAVESQNSYKMLVLPLHAGLSGSEQARVFQPPRSGVRKIIVSTNIAETSITVEDVVVVIDLGTHKQMHYDPINRASVLKECWISRSNARQRSGRAGRVREGCCYKLYTKETHEQVFLQSQTPEIQRVPLERLVLYILFGGYGSPGEFLNSLPEPPSTESIDRAILLLRDLSAVEVVSDKVHITGLGKHLAQLPMEVRVGKMLIYGSILGCGSEILTVAAMNSIRDPFLSSSNLRESVKKAKGKLLGGDEGAISQSDHICMLHAFQNWSSRSTERDRRDFCSAYFLNHQSLLEAAKMRKDFERELRNLGFQTSVSGELHDNKAYTEKEVLLFVEAAICAGLYPNLIHVRKPLETFSQTAGGAFSKVPEARQLRMMVRSLADSSCEVSSSKNCESSNHSSAEPEERKAQRSLERVFIHPSSVNFEQRNYPCPWMVYREKVKTSKIFTRETTVVPPYSILLFGGDIVVKHERGIVTVDGWIRFEAPARIGVLVREIRSMLDAMLEKKIAYPDFDVSGTSVISIVRRLLAKNGF